MKTRIISLILVLVMAVLTLASCAYNYAANDMSQYVAFDEDDFKAQLNALKIDDADFGTDEDIRWLKVKDTIYTQLGKESDKDEKLTEGKPGEYDLYYYCYYATYTNKDGEEIIVFSAKMKESGATELQLGLSSLKDLNKKIADALKDLDLKKDDAYSTDTSTETKTALGNMIAVSYKEAYTKPADGGKTEKVSNTVTNMIVTLPSAAVAEGAEPTLLDKLVGLNVAASEKKSFDIYRDINGDGTIDKDGDDAEKVEYTDVVVDWVVKSGVNEYGESGITVTDKTYTATTSEKDVYGKSYDLKDVELTYHIFPVYYVDVTEDITAQVVLDTLLGDSIKAPNDVDGDGVIKEEKDTNENGKIDEDEKSEEYEGSLDVFHDKDYKNGDEKIADLVKKLVELYTDLAEAEEDLETKQTAYDKANKTVEDKKADNKTPTKEEEDALTAATTNLNDAKKAKEDADKAVADQITKILGCTKAGDDKGLAAVIVEQYRQSVYDGLESTYKSAIKKNLATEIYAIVEELAKFSKDENGWWVLPRAAVDEAYKRVLNNYKYTFYEGDFNSTTSNYSKYNGDFYKFLKEDSNNGLGLGKEATMQDIYNALGAEAEAAVKDTIIVYRLAAMYGDDVKVTEKDIEDFKKTYQYFLLQYSLGYGTDVSSEYYMTALQLNKVLNYLLEENEETEDNLLDYVRVKYTFNEK